MRTFVFYEQIRGKTYASNFKCQDKAEAERLAEAIDMVLVGEIQEFKTEKWYGFLYRFNNWVCSIRNYRSNKG